MRKQNRKQELGLVVQFREKGILKHLQDTSSSDSSHCSEQLVLLGFSTNSGIWEQDGELTALTNGIPFSSPRCTSPLIFHMQESSLSGATLSDLAFFGMFKHGICPSLFFARCCFSQRKGEKEAALWHDDPEQAKWKVESFKRREERKKKKKLEACWHLFCFLQICSFSCCP